MSLPLSNTPIYNLTIPSTEKNVRYRPFLVKEEKALLVAQQSEDAVVMLDTLKNIIKSCIKDEVDVDSLATFDLEYIFTQLRAKSVGEVVELIFSCDTCTDEKARVKIAFDLTKLKVEKDPSHNKNIPLFNDVGVIMKYPSIELINKLQAVTDSNIDQIFEVVIDCIESIYTSDEVYHANEQTKAELMEFLENLTSEQFAKIQKFFETMPKIRQDVEYTCPVCGKHHSKYLEGINSFF